MSDKQKEQNRFLSFEEQFFIDGVLDMARRQGKKFALTYLKDCDESPSLSIYPEKVKRGFYVRERCRENVKKLNVKK